jgi:hypothetical protein
MNAPNEDLEALIRGAKSCPPVAPDGSARAGWDRLRGSLGAAVIVPQIDVPPALVESAIAGKTVAAASVVGWGWAGKAIASAAVTLVVGGVGVAASGVAKRDASPVPREVAASATPSASPESVASVVAPAELPSVASLPTATNLDVQPTTFTATPIDARTVVVAPESTAKRRATKPGAEAEAPIIAAAMRALVDGDATTALRELGRHRQLHPRGSMTEDREALRVSALCKAGRAADAAALRDEFLTKWPSSPHASRVRAPCTAG